MEYRNLGRTKLKVSCISLGCGPFSSNKIQPLTIKEIIKISCENGINLIETGEDYDETKIGNALSELGPIKTKLYIATKSTAYDQKGMHNSVNQSLLKLKKDFLDIYQLHSVNTIKELDMRLKADGALIALKTEQKNNRIGFIGITGHHVPTLISAVKTNEFDTVQVPYNITHTLAEELFDVCKDYGVGVMVMKPMGGGFLINRKVYGENPKKGAQNMTSENALKFVLSNERVHTALIGMIHPKQVKENINLCNQNLNLSEQERLSIATRAKEFFGDDYCRICKYCMPCAVHGWPFEIDTYLKLYGFYKKYGYYQLKEEYSKLKIKANMCTNCGECERKCPYHLPIRKMLKEAHLYLSPVLEENDLKDEGREQLITVIKNLKEDLKGREEGLEKYKFNIIEQRTEMKSLQKFIKQKEQDEQNLMKEIEERDKEFREKSKNLEKEIQQKKQELLMKEIEKRDKEFREKSKNFEKEIQRKKRDEQKLIKQIEEQNKEFREKSKNLEKEIQEKECELQKYKKLVEERLQNVDVPSRITK